MKPFNGFESKKSAGARELLPAGGYVAKILDAVEVPYDWGNVILISFDILEGDYKDFFKKDYKDRADAIIAAIRDHIRGLPSEWKDDPELIALIREAMGPKADDSEATKVLEKFESICIGGMVIADGRILVPKGSLLSTDRSVK